MPELHVVLLVGAAVLLVAIVAVRLSTRAGLPSLLLYLVLGLLLGENGVGIRFDDAALAQALGTGALVLILAEGGLTTHWATVRPALGPAAVLSTVGVAVSVAVTAGAAHLLLGADWQLALLLGAVVSSTDAAAVFSLLRALRLPPRLTGVLEAESGLNDAPVFLVVTALSAAGGVHDAAELPLLIAVELVGGVAFGLAVGWLGVQGLRRVALPATGLYPVAVLALAVLAYGVAATAHTSGFLAVYVTSLLLGNSWLPHQRASRSFAEGVAWLAQIGLFVMLGLLATPRDLPGEVLPALGVGLALLLLARPLSVLVTALPFRLPWREQALLSWAGLRGAVPIVLATIPLTTGVAGSERIFDLVFVLVIVFTLVQAPVLPLLARALRLVQTDDPVEVGIESAPLEHLHADLLEVAIPLGSRMHGVELFELRLPRGAAVTLVVRDGSSFVPDARTRLHRGDDLLVVVTSDVRAATERRLRAVSVDGRLASWVPPSEPSRPSGASRPDGPPAGSSAAAHGHRAVRAVRGGALQDGAGRALAALRRRRPAE